MLSTLLNALNYRWTRIITRTFKSFDPFSIQLCTYFGISRNFCHCLLQYFRNCLPEKYKNENMNEHTFLPFPILSHQNEMELTYLSPLAFASSNEVQTEQINVPSSSFMNDGILLSCFKHLVWNERKHFEQLNPLCIFGQWQYQQNLSRTNYGKRQKVLYYFLDIWMQQALFSTDGWSRAKQKLFFKTLLLYKQEPIEIMNNCWH